MASSSSNVHAFTFLSYQSGAQDNKDRGRIFVYSKSCQVRPWPNLTGEKINTTAALKPLIPSCPDISSLLGRNPRFATRIHANSTSRICLLTLSGLTDVLDCDGGARDRGAGQDLSVLLDVDESRSGGSHGAGRSAGRGSGEGHGAEVGKWYERAARGEVLHDPLGVELLQSTGLAGESVGDGGTLRHVLHDSGASCGGSSCDSHGNSVTG